MHNAQWGLRADALLISQSCTYWCHKACLRRSYWATRGVVSVKQLEQHLKQLVQLFYFSCKLGDGTVFEKK